MSPRYEELSAFATAFAREYAGWAASEGITQGQIAAVLGRNPSYVSERMGGKRALDTNDIDALAQLSGRPGPELTAILIERTAARLAVLPPIDARKSDYDVAANNDQHTDDLPES